MDETKPRQSGGSQFQQDQRFDQRYLRNKTEQFTTVLWDTTAATAANYGVFLIVLRACVVEEVWETLKVAGSDGGAVTLDIEKLTSGVALDSGTAVLSTPLSLKTTANTPQQGVLAANITSRQLSRGDRLAIKDAGTLTAVSGVHVSVLVRYRN